MMQIEIPPSTRADKKFQAVVDDQKTIHFGSKGASDFTLNKDKARKEKYERRHKKREDWTDPKTAGAYAKNILWNEPTVQGSIKDTNKRFKDIHIAYKSQP